MTRIGLEECLTNSVGRFFKSVFESSATRKLQMPRLESKAANRQLFYASLLAESLTLMRAAGDSLFLALAGSDSQSTLALSRLDSRSVK